MCNLGEDPIVLLGVLEKVKNQTILHRRCFPSKVGGKPAWLNPKSLPSLKNLACDSCGRLMTFLLQIHANTSEKRCFLRTQHVFCCRNCKDSFKSYRCQLPRRNEYYSYDPPDYENIDTTDEYSNLLCPRCGCPQGEGRCSCLPQSLFKQFEVLTEIAPDEDAEALDEKFGERSIALAHTKKLEENFKTMAAEMPEDVLDASEEEAFESLAGDPFQKDVAFQSFIQICENSPNHVIRYCLGGQPLWLSDKNQKSSKDLPKCQNCGSLM
eukprot:Filipodium_phascolosomae@DN4520_c0_g1_i1.p1